MIAGKRFKPTNKAPRLMPGRLIGRLNHITGRENKMLKTIIYMILTLAFGIWLIDQLWDSRELHNVKSDIESHYFQTQKMIDKLNERN